MSNGALDGVLGQTDSFTGHYGWSGRCEQPYTGPCVMDGMDVHEHSREMEESQRGLSNEQTVLVVVLVHGTTHIGQDSHGCARD